MNQDRTENFVTVDQYNDVATQFNELTESYVRMEKEMQERIIDLEVSLRDSADLVDEARSHITFTHETRETVVQTSNLTMAEQFPEETQKFEDSIYEQERHIKRLEHENGLLLFQRDELQAFLKHNERNYPKFHEEFEELKV